MVSIIIPNYNHAPYLVQRFQTVFNQTYHDYEVIVLDDCSTDNSRAIIERHRNHPKVSHVIFSDVNSGSAFRQWRKGLDLAKGDWIWIAESDDYCTEQLLDVLVRQAMAKENVTISYCQSNEVNEKGEGWRHMSWHTDKVDKDYWKQDYFTSGLAEIKKCLLHINSIPNASAVLFKKSAYSNADKSFESMKFSGDWMLWVQLLKQGNISFCAQAHNYFRQHATTTRVSEIPDTQKIRIEEEYKIAKEIQKTIKGSGNSTVKSKMLKIIRTYASFYTTGEILKYIARPDSYKGEIPLLNLVFVYFGRLAVKKTRRLFLR